MKSQCQVAWYSRHVHLGFTYENSVFALLRTNFHPLAGDIGPLREHVLAVIPIKVLINS